MKQNRIPLLIILLVVILVAGYLVINPQAGQDLLVEIGLAEPALEEYTASGMIEGDSWLVSSLAGGKVEMVYVSTGQTIHAGDKLLSFDTELLELQINFLEAELNGLTAQLALLENTPDEADQKLAERYIELAETALDYAEQALDEYEDSGLEDMDEINEDLLQAGIDAAQAELDKALAQQQALENAIQETDLEQLQAALAAKESEIAQLQDSLEKQTITAPADGTISDVAVLPGEVALPGANLIKISSAASLELTVYIPEADLNWVETGQQVSFRIDGYPDTVFLGEVSSIADTAEYTPRNVQTPEERTVLVFEVKISVLSSDQRLKPGIPADVTFEVEK